MRKIELNDVPEELTDEVVRNLTEEFKQDNTKRVWNKPYIKEQLLKMNYSKCAYSEVKLQQNSTYMEVEHFYPKSKYPDKVVYWGNLLPSCKTCNIHKKDTDPSAIELIFPLVDNPRKHLAFLRGICIGLDKKGRNSIACYDLNNEQFVSPRFDIQNDIENNLKWMAEDLRDSYFDTEEKRKRFLSKLCSVMQMGQPSAVYSLCMANVILGNSDFLFIKKYLEDRQEWSTELQGLEMGLSTP